jgi:hypothetical protein
MDPDTLAPTSALATSLIPAGVSRGSGDALAWPSPASQNPAQLLASLMDFPGSVALADLLAEPLARFCSRAEPRASTAPQGATARLPASTAAGAAAPADRAALGERLQLDAEARLDSLEPMVLKPLLGRRAPGVPAAHELLFSLRQYRIHENRSEANVTRLADYLGAPFRSALGLSLRQAQAQVATLRWEITHDLRALGPRAEQLERLDAALSRSMQAKLGELLDRMEHAAHLTFVRACAHAVEGLPEGLDDAALAAWCDPEGWLARYRERCVRMAKALFGHLRRGLEGLIRAAALVDSEQASAARGDAWGAGNHVAHAARESNTEDA